MSQITVSLCHESATKLLISRKATQEIYDQSPKRVSGICALVSAVLLEDAHIMA